MWVGFYMLICGMVISEEVWRDEGGEGSWVFLFRI